MSAEASTDTKEKSARDLRDVHRGIETQDPEVKYKHAVQNLRENFSFIKRNLPKSLGGEIRIILHQDDNLIEVVHYYDKRLPYKIHTAFTGSDCTITDLEREYDADDRLVETTIYGGPRRVVEDGDTPSKSSSSNSSPTRRRTPSRTRSTSTSNTWTVDSDKDNVEKYKSARRSSFALIAVGIMWKFIGEAILGGIAGSFRNPESAVYMTSMLELFSGMMTLAAIIGVLGIVVTSIMLASHKEPFDS